MKLNKIMTYLLISQMVLSLVGCGTPKESQKQIETQQEVSQVVDNSEVEDVEEPKDVEEVEKADSDKESTEAEETEVEETEAEEAEYIPNHDNYTVYVINTQRFDNPETLKSLGNLANRAVIERGQAVTLYVLDFESLPGDTDDKIDSVKIIDKQTGSDVTDILGNYADSQRGNACFGDFSFDDVTGENLYLLYTIDNYDISDLQFMIRTNGTVDYDDDSAGWFEVTNVIDGYDKQPRYYADNVIMNINGTVYQKFISAEQMQDSDNNIEYHVEQLIDLTHIGDPQVPSLTAEDFVFLDRETLEPVELPANAEFIYKEIVDDSFGDMDVDLCFGFKMTDNFTDDDMDTFMDSVIPAIKLDDGNYLPLSYTHDFLGF